MNSKQITLELAVRQQIKGLTDRANSLSEKRLNSNPQDIQLNGTVGQGTA